VTRNDPSPISSAELERLRRIEAAARRVLEEMAGGRKATPILSALAELRAALKDVSPSEDVGGSR
jgi:hypothetical protein